MMQSAQEYTTNRTIWNNVYRKNI